MDSNIDKEMGKKYWNKQRKSMAFHFFFWMPFLWMGYLLRYFFYSSEWVLLVVSIFIGIDLTILYCMVLDYRKGMSE